MDDRTSGLGFEGSKVARDYKNPLTATGLFRALDKLRFNDEHLPDAARRLVYVTDLSPACIYALEERHPGSKPMRCERLYLNTWPFKPQLRSKSLLRELELSS
jgi:hypothetical protein